MDLRRSRVVTVRCMPDGRPWFLPAMASRVVLGPPKRREELVRELPVQLAAQRCVEGSIDAKFKTICPSECQRDDVLGAGLLLGEVPISIRTVDQRRPSSSPPTRAILCGARPSRSFTRSGRASPSTLPPLRASQRRSQARFAAGCRRLRRSTPRIGILPTRALGSESRRLGQIEQRAAKCVSEPHCDVPVIDEPRVLGLVQL